MPILLLKGKPIGSVKGILFDKDGTLTNSENHLLTVANQRIDLAIELLKSENIKEKELNKFKTLLRTAYGINEKEITPEGSTAIASRKDNLISMATVICMFDKNWSEAFDIANRVFTKVDSLNNDGCKTKRPLLPGVNKMLNNLQAAQIRCGLISNDSKEGIEDFLKENSLKDKFYDYWSCESSPAKPNPSAVIEFCKKLKLKPCECALIGDSDSDLKMASLSGVNLVMGYVSGWSIPPKLRYGKELIYDWNDLSCQREN